MSAGETIVDKFLRYVAIPSQSNADADTVPTSDGQWELARLLVDELREVGGVDLHLDNHACVTARFPATGRFACDPDGEAGPTTSTPRLGFLAHLDTADVGLSPVVNPRIVRFEGKPVQFA